MTLEDARLFVLSGGHVKGLAVGTRQRYVEQWERFELFASRSHFAVATVGAVDRPLVEAFVNARLPSGSPPTPSTTRVRLSALRCLFRSLRDLGVLDGDPTTDIRLLSRAASQARPLTDVEVDRCRWASTATLVASRYPIIWALAEAGASTGEIGSVRRSDLDLGQGDVEVSGGRKESPRLVRLTAWGQEAVAAAAEDREGEWLAVDRDSDYDVRRASVTAALREILRRGGCADTDVEPRSVTAWAGQRIFAETEGRVEAVARALGLASLDDTAALIGFDWRERSIQ